MEWACEWAGLGNNMGRVSRLGPRIGSWVRVFWDHGTEKVEDLCVRLHSPQAPSATRAMNYDRTPKIRCCITTYWDISLTCFAYRFSVSISFRTKVSNLAQRSLRHSNCPSRRSAGFTAALWFSSWILIADFCTHPMAPLFLCQPNRHPHYGIWPWSRFRFVPL